MRSWLACVLLGTACAASMASPVQPPRTVLSLDGTWQIAEGSMGAMPRVFGHTAPVPGLADMATPAFAEVGFASAQRAAFWYRRSFAVAGPRRPVAVLKVNKAQFGTKVWLNGQEVGEHPGCFTPGYFDVASTLRYGAPNVLVIRVGAYRDALPPSVPTNTDYEQKRWIPGIYDSVSLILSGSPSIVRIQVAPRLAARSALAQVVVRNAGEAPATARLRLSVREWRSGRPVGALTLPGVRLAPGEERTVTGVVRLRAPHLWTPEDPFLYVLRSDTGADASETRFGMRTFGFDVKTGRAMLNGRPYFLRGTNFCMFRFFEDPQRGNLPWDRQWVRRLLTLPKKELKWNAARVCIAPFPEFWYDLADELGWLLQDEFPIWGFKAEWSQSELTTEFREWMQERWNHPSLAIWDACNETLEPRTGQLIGAVRDLDLSRRPWDDGYSPPNRPGDAVEDHPYRFVNPAFELDSLDSVLKDTDGLRKPPVIVNEFDWLWLDRQGNPTTLTRQLYDARLGPDATPEQRREFCADNTAALTEYWRARRKAAGVLHFCYLTYSRPNGQTCDNFVDLRNLVLEPRWLARMRDAYDPLGVMIDDYASWARPGERRTYRVVITNDLDRAQSGDVRLRLTRDARAIAERVARYRVPALGQAIVTFQIDMPAATGGYELVAERTAPGMRAIRSLRTVELLTEAEVRRRTGIAVGCAVTASSEIHDARGDFPARFAVDGKAGTRWSSEFADPQWLQIDLGSPKRFSRITLSWEAAFGKAYRIQVSDDARAWRDVYSTRDGRGGTETLRFAPTTARYVRLLGEQRGTAFGYSLWEFRVFEE